MTEMLGHNQRTYTKQKLFKIFYSEKEVLPLLWGDMKQLLAAASSCKGARTQAVLLTDNVPSCSHVCLLEIFQMPCFKLVVVIWRDFT